MRRLHLFPTLSPKRRRRADWKKMRGKSVMLRDRFTLVRFRVIQSHDADTPLVAATDTVRRTLLLLPSAH